MLNKLKRLFSKNKLVAPHIYPEELYTTIITEEFVKVEHPKHGIRLIHWANINEVWIINTDEGPAMPDVFLLLSGESESCFLPQNSTGFDKIYDIVSKYKGFNFNNFIESMSCVENKRFLLWKKE